MTASEQKTAEQITYSWKLNKNSLKWHRKIITDQPIHLNYSRLDFI